MKSAKHGTKTGSAWNRSRAVFLVVCSFALVSLGDAPRASAQALGAAPDPGIAVNIVRGPDLAMPFAYGASQPLADRWAATYGIGLADETSLSNAFLKFDRLFVGDPSSDRNSRDNWRHFLGLQFDAGDGFLIHGGAAKSSGVSGSRFVSPSGYERLRLSSGARWTGRNWGLDGSFSFIPTGATRLPGDAAFMPGMGSSNATWLFAFSVVRWF